MAERVFNNYHFIYAFLGDQIPSSVPPEKNLPRTVHLMLYFLSVILYLIITLILFQFNSGFSSIGVGGSAIVVINIVLPICFYINFKAVQHFIDKYIFLWIDCKNNGYNQRTL